MSESVGKAIQRLRMEKGWNLDELSGRSGVERGTLSRIELGKQAPHRSTLKSIIVALRPTPDALGTNPRLLEAYDESAVGAQSTSVGLEDRLAAIIDYVKSLRGRERTSFIRAAIALLTALEHARPATSTGTTPDDDH